MLNTVIPAGYSPCLNLYDTQKAIGLLKRLFEDNLGGALHLRRVSAPLFVEASTGLNDDLNGVERAVSFDIPDAGRDAQVVHSLAKWKRLALHRYQFSVGEGLYTDMNAIRRDEDLDNIHSVYVDQWDWEKVLAPRDRNETYLKNTVTTIVAALADTQSTLRAVYPQLTPLPTIQREVSFVTAQELEEKITDKTKLLILPYPNNPTGAVMRRADLEAVARVVERHNLLVLSDEIYSELTYGGTPHVCFSTIEGMRERTIVVNGFSKAFAMTGWRLGYAAGPKELVAQMTKLHQYGIMCAPTTAQYAAIEALKNGDSDIQNMRSQYDMRRRLIVDSFNRMGLTCFEPEGAFYVFPCIRSTGMTSEEFCEKLIYEQHVAVVPGPAFGACGEGFVRVSYSYSIKHITEALHRIERFLEEHRA